MPEGKIELSAVHAGGEVLIRVRDDGRIYAVPEPKDFILFVAGGLGGLHATAFHSFGSCLTQSRAVASPIAG